MSRLRQTPARQARDKSIKAALSAVALSILMACGGSPHPRAVSDAAAADAPAFIELRREVRANTLHFPAGVYSLSSTDKIGHYYRAPRKVAQHAAGSSLLRDGGIFVSKRNQAKLRGYVYLGGAVVHVGNFSRADYAFRSRSSEEDVPAAAPY